MNIRIMTMRTWAVCRLKQVSRIWMWPRISRYWAIWDSNREAREQLVQVKAPPAASSSDQVEVSKLSPSPLEWVPTSNKHRRWSTKANSSYHSKPTNSANWAKVTRSRFSWIKATLARRNKMINKAKQGHKRGRRVLVIKPIIIANSIYSRCSWWGKASRTQIMGRAW